MGVDKHYRVEWEKEDMFKGWLCKAPEDLISSGHGEAYCKWCKDSNKIYISDKHKSQELPKNPKRYSCDEDQQAQNVIVENFKQLQHKQREKFSSSNNVVHLTSISDDYQKKDEHYYWVMACASDLRNMEKTQQIYAKKAIAEIIMEGQLGTLDRDSVRINKRLDNDSIVLKIGSPLPEYERDGLQNDQD
ncbi:unnamed protein product [Danaus chrysippus]|uniref:(African queen) hypothetical protein n=1 Tax=Danaus chrysippus TaxID=151541 RepID=A0A8J2QT28_9NEOP|nr:unnamed protein product [Danaus chrysippus]